MYLPGPVLEISAQSLTYASVKSVVQVQIINHLPVYLASMIFTFGKLCNKLIIGPIPDG